jgi:two-component system sensor histidine kinase PhoQ
MLALVAGLYAGLRLGLRPLARLEQEIGEVEAGRRDRLGDGWPRELAGVTQNLNALLEGERARLGRYRSTLGNLAHSLKTPIAALRSLIGAGSLDLAAVSPQVERMQSIVEHQLRRAVLAGGGSTVAATPIRPPLVDLAAALEKVYRDRPVRCELDVPAGLSYPIEAGDLMELAGNLLDNACKYGRGRVLVRARPEERPQWRRPGLLVSIEDDGPGIPAADRARVLERGVRADESVAGQGIGLAAARELVQAYGGTIEIGESRLGGAAVRVGLPGR